MKYINIQSEFSLHFVFLNRQMHVSNSNVEIILSGGFYLAEFRFMNSSFNKIVPHVCHLKLLSDFILGVGSKHSW